jgi:acyl-coenzyme A thioesterase PaaI-like protein
MATIRVLARPQDAARYLAEEWVRAEGEGGEPGAVGSADPEVTAAFLETAAIIELSWTLMWEAMEAGQTGPGATLPDLPKTIDFTVDYLRSGLPRDAYARARVNRSGRRYASVHVEAWQDNRSRLFAQGTGHFLMPDPDGS